MQFENVRDAVTDLNNLILKLKKQHESQPMTAQQVMEQVNSWISINFTDSTEDESYLNRIRGVFHTDVLFDSDLIP